jgi:hypothetical protein
MNEHYDNFAEFVKDCTTATHEELMGWLEKATTNEIYRTVVLAEIQKRQLKNIEVRVSELAASSRRLEKLTIWLIVLTIVLAIITAADIIERLVSH